MEEHRLTSGSGKVFEQHGSLNDADYRSEFNAQVKAGNLSKSGVIYDPYNVEDLQGRVLSLFHEGTRIEEANPGELVEILLPHTNFYLESGGQVADQGRILSRQSGLWEIEITDVHKPVAGLIVHFGKVISGHPKVGDEAIIQIDRTRRMDIMRNHTATHLLHAALQQVLGEHARQSGSLVAPDRLRFDFSHPEALTDEQLEVIETKVNQSIYADLPLIKQTNR